MSKKRGPKPNLSIPINQKKYTLVANQPLTINLPEPFKISDSTFTFQCDKTGPIQTGNYTFKLKNSSTTEINGSVAITNPTFVYLKSSGNVETDAIEFTTLELTCTNNLDIYITFENLVVQERMKPNQGRFGKVVTYKVV